MHPLTDDDGQARFIIGLSSNADADVRDESDLQLMRKLVPTSCPHNPEVDSPRSTREAHFEAEMAIFTLVLCCESPVRWFNVAARTPEVINAFFEANEELFKPPKDPKTLLNDFQLLRYSVELRGLEGRPLQLRIESMWLGVKPPPAVTRRSSTERASAEQSVEDPTPSGTAAPNPNSSEHASPRLQRTQTVASSTAGGSRPASATRAGTVANIGKQDSAQGAIRGVEATPKATEVVDFATDMAQAVSGTTAEQRQKIVFERMQQAERAVAESLWLDHVKGEAVMGLLEGSRPSLRRRRG